jgi:hypothetical protein
VTSTNYRTDHLISGVIPSGEPIAFKPFEGPVEDTDVYIVRKGDLWWQARIVHRDGDSKTGLYGVLVTAKTVDGRLVCYEPGAFIYGRALAGTPLALSREASLVAQRHEASALRRAAEGSTLRVARPYTHLNRTPTGQHEAVGGTPRVFNGAPRLAPRPARTYQQPSRPFDDGYMPIHRTAPKTAKPAGLTADVSKVVEAEVKKIATRSEGDAQ